MSNSDNKFKDNRCGNLIVTSKESKKNSYLILSDYLKTLKSEIYLIQQNLKQIDFDSTGICKILLNYAGLHFYICHTEQINSAFSSIVLL